MGSMNVFAGGAWRKAKGAHVFTGGAWRKAKAVWVFTAGAWRQMTFSETAVYTVRTIDFPDELGYGQGSWGAVPGGYGSIVPVGPDVFGLTEIVNDDGSSNVQQIGGGRTAALSFRATATYAGQSKSYDIYNGSANYSLGTELEDAHRLTYQAQRDGQPYTLTLTTIA